MPQYGQRHFGQTYLDAWVRQLQQESTFTPHHRSSNNIYHNNMQLEVCVHAANTLNWAADVSTWG